MTGYAVATSESAAGTLAIVKTRAQHETLFGAAVDAALPDVILGASDEGTEGLWLWPDGSQLDDLR